MTQKLKVDSEFAALMPEHSDEERRELRALIIEDGCEDAVTLWGDVIVDGMTRYDICKNEGLEFPTRQKEFADREAAKRWIIRRQLGRRNLTDDQRAMLAAKLVETRVGDATYQNDKSSRSDVAAEANVGVQKVDRARAVISRGSDKLQEAVRDGDVGVSDATSVLNMPKSKQDAAVKAVESGKAETVAGAAYDIALKAIAAVNAKAASDLQSKKWKLSKKRVIEIGSLGKEEMAKELRDERLGRTVSGADVPKKSKADELLKDDSGNDVPEKLRPVFILQPLFDIVLNSMVPGMQTNMRRIAETIKEYRATSVDVVAKNLHTIFSSYRPAYVCKECAGEGCKKCNERGWRPKACR